MIRHTNFRIAAPDNLAPADQWRKQAACTGDPDAMYPDNNEAGIAYAQSICAGCSVRAECLDDAISTGELQHGIRGGLRPKERRALTRNKPVPADKPKPPATLEELLDQHLVTGDNGHTFWTGTRLVHFGGARYTAMQAAFVIGYGRAPDGKVVRTCGLDCFTAAHLTDGPMRDANAICGTRRGYQRHRKHGETACDPCRRANADADNRLRRTGTTKQAA